MIFVGYQGIGKSTLCKRDQNCIDLESSNFRVDGKRSDDWYKVCAKIAVYLSKKGFDVFVSSHAELRSELKKYEGVIVCGIVPDIKLRDLWIDKLQDRYDYTGLDKDYRALMNAKDRLVANVSEIINDLDSSIVLQSMDYDLQEQIFGFKHIILG